MNKMPDIEEFYLVTMAVLLFSYVNILLTSYKR